VQIAPSSTKGVPHVTPSAAAARRARAGALRRRAARRSRGLERQGSAALVRVAHFSPDAPAVDVYVNDDRVLSGVAYPAVSKYLELPAGSYTFAVRPAGAAASSDPVIEETAGVKGGAAYTVAAVGALADIKAAIFADDLSAPGSGKSKVRVIHAAPEVPAVDVAVKDGPTLFEGAKFPSATDYAEVDAASYPVQVKPAGGDEVLLEANLAVKAGTIYSVAAIGGPARTSACCRSWTPPAPARRRTVASPPAPAGPRRAPPFPASPSCSPAGPTCC
jgi:uncharacterized protein DUF4397